MSVSTPILTTSSEICAFAAVPATASARPAATTAASDFMVLFSLVFLLRIWCRFPLLSGFAAARKADFLGAPGHLSAAQERAGGWVPVSRVVSTAPDWPSWFETRG